MARAEGEEGDTSSDTEDSLTPVVTFIPFDELPAPRGAADDCNEEKVAELGDDCAAVELKITPKADACELSEASAKQQKEENERKCVEAVELRAAAMEDSDSVSLRGLVAAKQTSEVSAKVSTERMANGCPHFIAAIKEGDFEKFKCYWTQRIEVPTDAVFESDNAMHWAARCDRVDVLRYLLSDGALDVNAESYNGWTALMYATMEGHCTAVRLLLSVDTVDVNKQNTHGCTAVIIAAMYDQLECAQLLVEWGCASLSIRDKTGQTALSLATMSPRQAVVSFLKSKPVAVSKPKQKCKCPCAWF